VVKTLHFPPFQPGVNRRGGFLRYAHKQGAVLKDITEGIRGPRVHPDQPEFLTVEEARALLRAPWKGAEGKIILLDRRKVERDNQVHQEQSAGVIQKWPLSFTESRERREIQERGGIYINPSLFLLEVRQLLISLWLESGIRPPPAVSLFP